MKIVRYSVLAILATPLLNLLLPGRPWVTFGTASVIAFVTYRAEKSPELKEALLNDTEDIRAGQRYRMLSSALVHGGYLHLLFNMFTFLSFAPVLEAAFVSKLGAPGRLAFAASIVGIMALQGQIVYEVERRTSRSRSLGASGMVLGMFAAITVLHPMTGIVVFLILPMKAWLFLVLFLAFTVWAYRSPNSRVDSVVSFGVSSNIHHLGHLVGMLLGLVLGFSLLLV